MLQGSHPCRRTDTACHKTVASNGCDFCGHGVTYPLGHLQSKSRSRTHAVMADVMGDTVVLRIRVAHHLRAAHFRLGPR